MEGEIEKQKTAGLSEQLAAKFMGDQESFKQYTAQTSEGELEIGVQNSPGLSLTVQIKRSEHIGGNIIYQRDKEGHLTVVNNLREPNLNTAVASKPLANAGERGRRGKKKIFFWWGGGGGGGG